MAKKSTAKVAAKTAAKAVAKAAGKAAKTPARSASRTPIRKEWTKDDLRQLKSLAKQKTPARDIASSLERTEGAVRQKAFAEGLSLSVRKSAAKRRK
jgi:hypothetical protein